MGSLSELADSLTPNVPARMTNLGANSDNLLVESGALDPDWWINQLVEQHSTDAFAAAIGRGASLYRPYWREPSGRE